MNNNNSTGQYFTAPLRSSISNRQHKILQHFFNQKQLNILAIARIVLYSDDDLTDNKAILVFGHHQQYKSIIVQFE